MCMYVICFVIVEFFMGIKTCYFDACLTCFQAQQRAGKKVVVIPKRPASTVLNDAMVPDISDCPNTVSAYV